MKIIKVDLQHSKHLFQIVHFFNLPSESEGVDEVADDRDYSLRNEYQEPETIPPKFQYIAASNEITAGDPLP